MASSSSSSGASSDASRISRRISGRSPEKAKLDPCRLGARRKQYCTQWEHLDVALYCSGCRNYQTAIDGKPPSGRSRQETHGKSRIYQCHQPWTASDEDGEGTGNYRYNAASNWTKSVATSIETGPNATSLARLKTNTPTSGTTHSNTKRAIEVVDVDVNNNQDISPLDDASESPTSVHSSTDGRKKKKSKEEINVDAFDIKSQGHAFTVDGVPKSHVVIHKNKLKYLQNIERKVRSMEESLLGERCTMSLGPLSKCLLGVAFSSAPTLPLSQAAHIMPMMVASVLSNFGFLEKTNIEGYAHSFPSETYLRDLMYDFAAENVLELGQKILGKPVFLSCDKGNKKGVGHFVKVLSWFNDGYVQKQVLDIDASEGNTDQCAIAIQASLLKVNLHVLQGQCTDSGGGGVLDDLASALSKFGLCDTNYLVSSCSLHNLQLTIAKPIKETMGEGGLDKRNVMQLLHTVYDLQESVCQEVWKFTVKDAQEFMLTYGYGNDYEGFTPADKTFAAKWMKVKRFRVFEDELTPQQEKKTNSKFSSPVLTRWWTVGEAAKTVFDSYLLLMKISQSIINSTTGKSNKIASCLQPLLMEPEIYSDLTLLRCYFSTYLDKHFQWMQSEIDLSGVPGFQAHNTLGRYYLIQKELEEMKATSFVNHPAYKTFRLSLIHLSTDMQVRQRKKVQTFIDIAVRACHKHFNRWGNEQLLPAALLSEGPTARVVAAVMMKKTEEIEFEYPVHHSFVHGADFDMKDYLQFVAKQVDADAVYDALAFFTARLVWNGEVDLRDMSKPNFYKSWMYSTYLPLASQTQFVEAGVKEAKIVSQSDRSEQLRSVYAINRSARVHPAPGETALREQGAPERVCNLLKTAKKHVEVHNDIRDRDVVDYSSKLADIARVIRQDHFKKERIEGLLATANNKQSVNKKENCAQQKTGVDRTLDQLGFVAYGKLTKNPHLPSIRLELIHRGCPEEQTNTWKITECKHKLKEHELRRLRNTPIQVHANKGFQPQSAAQFDMA
jgi:hypothetical protein